MDWIGYILSSTAGLVMVIGSLLLLWKGRIVLDTHGKSMSRLELPGGIKFGTQFPVLVMFFLGVVLLIYPVYQARNICPDLSLHKQKIPEIVTITGQVKTDKPIDVYACVAEQKAATDNISLPVPYVSDRSYTLFRGAADGHFYPMDSIVLSSDKPHKEKYSLERPLIVQTNETSTPSYDEIKPVKTASQEQLSNFLKPEVAHP